MGRYRSRSCDSYGGRSQRSDRSSKIMITRYDDSDQSSFYSQGSYGDDYENRSMSSRFSFRSNKSGRKKFEADDWMSDSVSSESDDSYYPSRRKSDKNPYKERRRSKSGSRSHRREDFSETDQSDSYRSRRRTMERSSSNRSLGAPRRGSESRKGYDNTNDRSNFSSRVNQMKRDNDESVSSYEKSTRRQRSSQHTRKSRHKSREKVPDSNPAQTSRQSVSSRQQLLSRSTSTPQLLSPTAIRNIGSNGQAYMPNQQSPAAGMLGNRTFVNPGQGQTMMGISPNNIQGNANPRLQVGPGNFVRSMSGRSINILPQGQAQLSRSIQNGIASPIQQSPMMRGTSQRSLCSTNLLQDNSMQNRGLMNGSSNMIHGNGLPGTPVYSQRPGFMRGASQSNLSNVSTQRPGLAPGSSQRSLGNINTSMNAATTQSNSNERTNAPISSSMSRLVGDTSMMSTKSRRSLPPSSHRIYSMPEDPSVISRRSLPPQSRVGQIQSREGDAPSISSNSRRRLSMQGHSKPGDAIIPSRSRRDAPAESLADQIYSRNRGQSQHGCKQSHATYKEPPGADCNNLNNKTTRGFCTEPNGMHPDDKSCDSFRDDQESYISSKDPPDNNQSNNDQSNDQPYHDQPYNAQQDNYQQDNDPLYIADEDQTYSDVTGDASESDSYDSDDQQAFNSRYDTGDGFDEEEKYDEDEKCSDDIRPSNNMVDADTYDQESRGSVSDSSISSHSSAMDQRNEIMSPSRLSSDIAFEYDGEVGPSQTNSLSKYEIAADVYKNEFQNKNRFDSGTSSTEREPIGVLAGQKSTDKNTTSHSMELNDRGIHESKNLSSRTSTFDEKDFEDIIASDAVGHTGNIFGISDNNIKSRQYDEIDYIRSYKSKDAIMISSTKTKGSDDSTTTTDSMTREVPSVILGGKGVTKDSFTDLDSMLSSPDDERNNISPRISVVYESDNNSNDSPRLKERETSAHKSQRKKSYTDTSSRKHSKEKHSKKATNKSYSKNDEVARELDRSTKKSRDIEEKSRRIKSFRDKRKSKEKEKSKSRVSSRSKEEERDEKIGFERQNVMNLIDKLKSFELG